MGLQSLELRNFRLFDELTLTPDPSAVTVLISPNGTGKTSVLEAVYALATASSFRTTSAADMIRNGTTVAEVHGILTHRERRLQVDLTMSRGARNVVKRMLVNNQKPSSRADLAEALPVTVFTPEGVDMIRQGPDGRRHFLTTLMTDVYVHSSDVVERFERVLRQRNALLRSAQTAPFTADSARELDVWTQDVVTIGEELVLVREDIVRRLQPLVAANYQDLSGRSESVRVTYERSWVGDLGEALARSRDDDRFRGYTTVGPHRDDILVALDGRDARRQASQGEQRSLALALRLAGHALVRDERGVDPLLLLDDVFSELDPVRSERLLHLLPHGQTLVTTASPLPTAMVPAAVVDLTARAS